MIEVLRLFLVYFSACLALLWIAHRWLGKIRRPVAVVLILLPLVSTGSAMVSGGFYGALNLSYNTPPLFADAEQVPGFGEYQNGPLADQIYQVVPWRKAVRELVKTGHLPLMNRFTRGGDPLLAASQPAPFDPKVWIGFLLPLATAITFACSFVFFQAAFFTYLLARDLGISACGAVMAGAVFMTCGFVDFYITWSLASVVVTLPLLLLGLRRIARGESHGVPAAFVAWLLALVGGHPESVLHVTVVGGVYFLWQLRPSGRSPQAGRGRAVAISTATGLFALALAAPVVLPFIEVLPQTTDFHVRQGHHGPASLSWSEVGKSALGALYPQGWGPAWTAGRPELPQRFNAASGAFVGTVALALALVGAFGRSRERFFFAGLAVVSFGLAVGTPWLSDALAELPLFSLALNGRLVFVTAFALSILAADGFELLRLEPTRRRLAMILSVTAVVGLAGFGHIETMERIGLDKEPHVSTLPWLILTPIALVATALLIRSPALLGALWIGLLLVGQGGALPHFYESFDRELFYPRISELGELPRFGVALEDPFGEAGAGEPYRIVGRFYDLVPGQSALFELEDMRGPSVMSHRRLAHLSKAWCQPLHAWFCRVDDLDSPLLDFFNVRYAVADPAAPTPAGWEKVVAGRQLAIFENPEVLPRAFAPEKIEWVASHFPVARRMTEAEALRNLAWIEDGERRGRRQNGKAILEIRADGPDLRLRIQAEHDAWIVVSQTFWAGWRAETDDGQRLPLLPANHAFMAFEAPAGESEVRLFYRPMGWDIGVGVSGFAVVAAFVFAGLRLRRRSRNPSGKGEHSLRVAGVAAADEVALSVIIPAFNEERRLPFSLRQARDYLHGRDHEIIVVDDGSDDRTSRVAASFEGVRVIRLERNEGKGGALRHGVLASRGRRVLLTDADASIPIDQLERLGRSEAPVVIASRMAPGAVAERESSRLRRVMGRVFNRLLRLAGVAGDIVDTQCGFKLLDGDVARSLFRRSITRGFAFDVEILWLARRAGCRIEEVGVRWCHQPSSRVRPWLDPFRMMIEVARFSWHHRVAGSRADSSSDELVTAAVDGQ